MMTRNDAGGTHADQPHVLTPQTVATRSRRDDITPRAVEDSLLVLDRSRGQIHQLNATAGFIWNHCDGSRKLCDIATLLAGAFPVDYATAERDVLFTVQQFHDLGLVSLGTPRPSLPGGSC